MHIVSSQATESEEKFCSFMNFNGAPNRKLNHLAALMRPSTANHIRCYHGK
jgi:hypothetical protein